MHLRSAFYKQSTGHLHNISTASVNGSTFVDLRGHRSASLHILSIDAGYTSLQVGGNLTVSVDGQTRATYRVTGVDGTGELWEGPYPPGKDVHVDLQPSYANYVIGYLSVVYTYV